MSVEPFEDCHRRVQDWRRSAAASSSIKTAQLDALHEQQQQLKDDMLQGQQVMQQGQQLLEEKMLQGQQLLEEKM
jgi:hypothetical protein